MRAMAPAGSPPRGAPAAVDPSTAATEAEAVAEKAVEAVEEVAAEVVTEAKKVWNNALQAWV